MWHVQLYMELECALTSPAMQVQKCSFNNEYCTVVKVMSNDDVGRMECEHCPLSTVSLSEPLPHAGDFDFWHHAIIVSKRNLC